MPECGCESVAVGSFTCGILFALLVVIVSAVVMHNLNWKIAIKRRTPSDDLPNGAHENAPNAVTTVAFEGDTTTTPGCSSNTPAFETITPATTTAAAATTATRTITTVVFSTSTTATPDRPSTIGLMEEHPTGTQNPPLRTIDEEQSSGIDTRTAQSTSTDRPQEGTIPRVLHHVQCPTCGCSITMMSRPLSLVNTHSSRQTTSSGSGWTEESIQCENTNGEYVFSDANNSIHITHSPSSECILRGPNVTQAPSGELSENAVEFRVVQYRTSSGNNAIRKCNRETIMPPGDNVISYPGCNEV